MKKVKVKFVEELDKEYEINVGELNTKNNEIKLNKLEVYKDMSKEEIKEYEQYKANRNKKVNDKFEER